MTHENFFVAGLPRSRTAWLSVLLSDVDTFCYHELLESCRGFSDFHKKLADPLFHRIGNSDSSLPLYWHRIKNKYKNSPLIIVWREKEVCTESLKQEVGLTDEQAESLIDLIYEKLNRMEPTYSINFEELDNYEDCNKIFNHITNRELNYERWRTLNKLNISVELPKLELKTNKEVLEWLGLEV